MSKPPLYAPARPVEILVVDDSAVVRQALKAIIEEEPGFHVQTASDPYDAVAVMSRMVPDAIVLDVDMPRMDGLTFLRKLMRQHPLPVLLCTDHAQRGLTALELGARRSSPSPTGTTLGGWLPGRHGCGKACATPPPARPRPRPLPCQPPCRATSHVGDPSRATPRIRSCLDGPSSPAARRASGSSRSAPAPGASLRSRGCSPTSRATPGIVIVQHMPEGFTAAHARGSIKTRRLR